MEGLCSVSLNLGFVGLGDELKSLVNKLTSDPIIFTVLMLIAFTLSVVFYRVWTKPLFFTIIMVLIAAFAIFSFGDPNFFNEDKAAKPDNAPIVGLIFIAIFFVWLSLRQAAVNDERMMKGGVPVEKEETSDRVLVWPDLVMTEFLCMIIASVVLVIWSIGLKAPQEQAANPMRTPNPSKAPWYFLGLQEMLVYFDPWIAGVVLPGMIISGLILIPYCDRNPKGSGYYTFKERPFIITLFLFGFIILWIQLIIMGTFLRGPNWNFFGLYEPWTEHKLLSLNNVNLSEYFWVMLLNQGLPTNPIVRELPGIILVAGYFLVMPALLAVTVFKKLYKDLGMIRYSLMVVHLLVMAGLVLKMLLRWTINLKYIIYIPGYNI